MDLKKVTRFEVIDHTLPLEAGGGRVYTRYNVKNIEAQLQDDDRTLKIFITKPEQVTD